MVQGRRPASVAHLAYTEKFQARPSAVDFRRRSGRTFASGTGSHLAVGESSARNYALRDPDVRLMLEVRDDNAAAFEELMLRYQNRLVTVLEHLTGNRDAAEDLGQEVFMRVYRSRKKYV